MAKKANSPKKPAVTVDIMMGKAMPMKGGSQMAKGSKDMMGGMMSGGKHMMPNMPPKGMSSAGMGKGMAKTTAKPAKKGGKKSGKK